MVKIDCPDCGKHIETHAMVEIIPLDYAVLCVDCRAITRAVNSHCPACGSQSVLNLAKVLDRKEANIDGQDKQDEKHQS